MFVNFFLISIKINIKRGIKFIFVTFLHIIRLTDKINRNLDLMTKNEFNRFVDTLSDNIFRFALKSVQNRETAEDIVQDSFEKLWINRNSIDKEKIKSYLFKTTYNSMIDFFRREKYKNTFSENEIFSHSHNEQYSDIQEILHKLILNLPEKQRTVLLLRDYEGYSYKEIAEITELTEAQVKIYIYRARVFLKDCIKTPHNLI